MSDRPRSPAVAIVTGGARGIGAGIARRLSDDGFEVAILDLDGEVASVLAAELEARGGRSVAVTGDVADEQSVNQMVADVRERLGEPTVLVNNAGVIRDNLLFKMTVDDWDMVMDIHLRGAFLMARAVQSSMVQAGWGRIVNLSSVSALGSRGQANYSAAKAGLQGFTKTLAIELGPFGVTVNAVAPGFIETDMTAATARRIGIDFEQFKRDTAAITPVRRTGVPDDIAHAVSFFASEAAGFVSGQALYVAGGPFS